MSCCFGGGEAQTRPAGATPMGVSRAPQTPVSPHAANMHQTTPPAAEMSFTRQPLPPGCERYTFRELQGATGNFADNAVIGEGGFGKVFRGTLEDGTAVAIKRLDRLGLQGDREFNVEVNTLGRLRHPNLVDLLGACTEGRHRLAVFSFMPGGSLRDNLDRKQTASLGPGEAPRANLLWPTRLGVALDAAKGLAYLHEGTQPGVIHRDVKSSNVLIDSEGRARVADFGLALRTGGVSGAAAAAYETPDSGDPTEMLTGTFGYSAPEYEASGKMSQKCDVYSFGVVLLELLTGQAPVDTNASRQIASHKLTDDLHALLVNADIEGMMERLDPVMPRGSVPSLQLAYFIQVAAECLHSTPAERPRMSEVVRYLQKIAALDEGVPTPAPAQDGGSRYSLLNLMDAAAQVPPLSSSSGVLLPTPTPLDYRSAFMHPSEVAGAWQAQPSSNFLESPPATPDILRCSQPDGPQPCKVQSAGLNVHVSTDPLGPSHWPSMPLSPSAAARDTSAQPSSDDSSGVEGAFLASLLAPGSLAPDRSGHGSAASGGGVGWQPRASDAGLTRVEAAQHGEGWIPFGAQGGGGLSGAGSGDPAHLYGPLQMGMGQLLVPHRRPPLPPT